ncbi:hypothetical protein ACIQNG_26595 [Streptomyces sp. NPDC091377]|uniref:hypothetical protein n=1 Tax=unclassified Streptomyces TaxID=2593676 RepID=UPI00381879AE
MLRRLSVLVGAAVATAGLLFATAPSASADPFFTPRSHHSSYAECDAAGKAGKDLWGLLYKCEPFPTRPDVYVLWVRI